MAYVKQEPTALLPGLSGAANAVGLVLNNADSCYEYAPQVLCDPRFRASTSSGSDVKVAEWVIPKNADLVPIYVAARIKTTAGTATLTFKYTDGTTTLTTTIARTNTSYTWVALAVSGGLSAGVHPKFGQLFLRTTAGTASVESVLCVYYPIGPYPADGVLASGFCKTFWWDRDSSEDAFPSLLAQQILANPRAVARDRGAALFSAAQDLTHGSTGDDGSTRYLTTSTTLDLVERWIQPASDVGLRKYRLSAYLSGTNPELQVTLGSYVWLVSGTGWQHDTPELSLGNAVRGTAHLRVASGAGTAYLDTLQVLREAA